MAKLVECVPNFSVSRETDPAVFQGLVDTANSIPGCTFLESSVSPVISISGRLVFALFSKSAYNCISLILSVLISYFLYK